MRTLSLIISSVFHPTFIPLIGFLLLYSLTGYALYLPKDVFWFSIMVIAQFTILIPVGVVYFLYWRKKISSIELSNRKERPLPLVINLISYAVSFVIFRYLHYPNLIVSFFAVVVVSAAFSMVVSLYYKLSLHMVAWGSLVGVLLAISVRLGIGLHLLISLVLILTAIIASARLWLNEHDLPQVAWAWGVSSILSFLLMIFL